MDVSYPGPVARRRTRQLVVGRDRFFWSVAHVHAHSDSEEGTARYADCREVVRIRQDGLPGRLEIVFRADTGRRVPDGLLASGIVHRTDGGTLNLNEPGVVRALLDEALARGWQAGEPGRSQIDGWTLFDVVLARRISTPNRCVQGDHPGDRCR